MDKNQILKEIDKLTDYFYDRKISDMEYSILVKRLKEAYNRL